MHDVPPPRFSLSLLGRFELTGPDGVVDLPSKKLVGVLTYLACTAPRPQRRETLSALLWGSGFDLQAKQNLRQALFRLRKVLGHDAILGDGEIVSLDRAIVRCDVSRFEALLRDGSHDALSSAADLYRDRLVDDIVIDEEGWDEWVTGERARLQELALGGLLRLGEQELADGRGEAALKTGQRAITLNNLREDAHRLIVRALAAAGRKAEALKHYQDLVALLERELNAEPDAATRLLAIDLRGAQPVIAKDQPKINSGEKSDHTLDEQRSMQRSAASAAVPVPSAGPDWRHLTIMICTLLGSPFSPNPDPEEIRDRTTSFYKMAADLVARFDGFVAQYLPDGVHVYFGYPAAHEHDAEQAVRAGLAIIDAVAALRSFSGVPPRACVSIATGSAVVGDQPGAGESRQPVAIGDAPNLAAQLQSVAASGEVVIAASTRRLVGRMFDCRALATDELKGLLPSGTAWQVRGEMAGVSRFEARRASAPSPLVGRQEEMELLLRRWDQTKRGEGRVVLLSGEPGIGKSRIAESLLARLEGEPCVCLRYFCSPHHTSSPLYPLIEQLERAAGFTRDSDAEARLDKLETLLSASAKNVPRDLALITHLLSLDSDGRYPAVRVTPQQRREMTLTALLDQLDGAAAKRPVLMIFEDVHWIDPTSLDLLDRTIARAVDLPMLLVITLRSEFQPTWVGQPHVTVLPLSRLGRRDSESIIAGMANGKSLPEAVVEQILARADGVPLFIEELTSMLLEGGLLRETKEGYVLDGALPALAIPTTLQDSLAARLDRLQSDKHVTQTGAAIGREFSHELIRVVASLAPADLDAALERLTASGLISRRGAAPIATYAFKHALVQDAAYATLPKSRRQKLHARIADALIVRFPALAQTQPELVAHHFTQAGAAADAVKYWMIAARRGLQQSANIETLDQTERALAILASLPDGRERRSAELQLRLLTGGACWVTKGFASREVEHSFARARELAIDIDDVPRLFLALRGLAACHQARGELGRVKVQMEHMIALAQQHRSSGDLMWARMMLGLNLFWLGEFDASRSELKTALSIYDPVEQSAKTVSSQIDPGVLSGCYLGVALWMVGCPDQARDVSGRTLAQARRIGQPYSVAYALYGDAVVKLSRGDTEGASTGIAELRLLTGEHRIIYLAATATLLEAVLLVACGSAEDGVARIRQAQHEFNAQGAELGLPLTLSVEATGLFKLGRVEEALARIADGLAVVEKNGERHWEAELYRLKGEFLASLSASRHPEAEDCVRHGMQVARDQGATSLELRAASTLSELLHAGGDTRAAEHCLAPVYSRFTEGFDTADLLKARGILVRLQHASKRSPDEQA
jgi:DNA-binding SARP family transcriptional activator/predicted ATPase